MICSWIETLEKFLSGKHLDENIRDQVLQSQKTIALISEDYLNSDHCIKELEIAMTVQGGRRLVMVVLDVPVVKDFIRSNQILKRYLQSFKYLDYDNGSLNFYKQLIKCLIPQGIKEIDMNYYHNFD